MACEYISCVAALPQLDRGSDYESERHRFESYTPHQLNLEGTCGCLLFYFDFRLQGLFGLCFRKCVPSSPSLLELGGHVGFAGYVSVVDSRPRATVRLGIESAAVPADARCPSSGFLVGPWGRMKRRRPEYRGRRRSLTMALGNLVTPTRTLRCRAGSSSPSWR